jgi:hypothetical protein
MAELSHWQGIVVPQRQETGCIPTGYEWMIRYLGGKGVNLETFQEDFDLQYRHEGDNSFVPIAQKVKERYPQVGIKIGGFPNGKEKAEFIKKLIEEDVPCVMSIAKPTGGWHIVPVVSIDDTKIKVIWIANAFGNQVCEYSITDVIFRHNNWSGGKDIAWIEK